MKSFLTAFVICAFLAGTSGCSKENEIEPPAAAPETIDWDFYNERAEEFILAAANGDFAEAAAMFDDTMTRVFGEEGLRGAWEDVIALTGGFIEIHEIQNGEADGYYISGVVMRCENTGFGWNVVFSKDGLIAGLNTGGTIPIRENANALPKEPETWGGVTDYPVILAEGTEYPINALFSVPNETAGSIPAVLIVQGSGPHDMDGTIYGKKPYRDIAQYLADSGIAVIRWDKRTYTYGDKIARDLGGLATVWEECIEDALLAAEFLRADPRIDKDRVFIIGHSLGGSLAPRVNAEGGDFAGLILMAATPRNLSELFIEQTTASAESGCIEGLITEEQRDEALAQTQALEEFFSSIGSMSFEEAVSTPVPGMGVYSYYFMDLQNHPFTGYAKYINAPLLVLQGGRDYQVLPDVDYALLMEIFGMRDNVTFKKYNDLNHMFMPSAASNFTQHAREITSEPGVVDEAALKDIADWIHDF